MKRDFESEAFKAWKSALILDGQKSGDRAVEYIPEFIFWELYDWGVEPTIEAVKEYLKRHEQK